MSFKEEWKDASFGGEPWEIEHSTLDQWRHRERVPEGQPPKEWKGGLPYYDLSVGPTIKPFEMGNCEGLVMKGNRVITGDGTGHVIRDFDGTTMTLGPPIPNDIYGYQGEHFAAYFSFEGWGWNAIDFGIHISIGGLYVELILPFCYLHFGRPTLIT